MKSYSFYHWILVGTMATLCGCRSDRGLSPPQPPESPSQDRQVPCRGGECDELEAGEEAQIQVIEIEDAEESAALVPDAPREESKADKPAHESVDGNSSVAIEELVPPESPALEVHVEAPERQMDSAALPSLTEDSNSLGGPVSESQVVLP